MSRPEFASAWSRFVEVNVPVATVGRKIGGKVGQNIASGIFRNACPLNYTGVPIPAAAIGSSTASLGTALVILACALAATPVAAAPPASLRDWALARCLTRAYGLDTPAGKDAADSATALLERGIFGPRAIDAVEAAIGKQLAKPYAGSTGGRYAKLKCLDLDRDPAFARTGRSLDGRR